MWSPVCDDGGLEFSNPQKENEEQLNNNEKEMTPEEYETMYEQKRSKRGKFFGKWSLRILGCLFLLITLIAVPVNIFQLDFSNLFNGNNSQQINNYTYSDVAEYAILEEDIFEQKEEFYLVYVYKNSCSICEQIKPTVLNFAINSGYRMYFVNTSNLMQSCDSAEISKNNSVGTNDVRKLYLYGTPTIFAINQGSVHEVLIGGNEITNSLNKNFSQ